MLDFGALTNDKAELAVLQATFGAVCGREIAAGHAKIRINNETNFLCAVGMIVSEASGNGEPIKNMMEMCSVMKAKAGVRTP